MELEIGCGQLIMRHENNYRANLLRVRTISLLSLIIFAALTLTRSGITQQTTKSRGEVCVEDFLAADRVHDGTDYGAAVNAAVQSLPLLEASELSLCRIGNHPVFTQMTIDRPVTLIGHAGSLVVQRSLSHAAHGIAGVEARAGERRIRLPPGSVLEVGEAIGGLGIATGSTVLHREGDIAELSLPARLVVYGRFIGLDQLAGVNSLAGLRVGQRVACERCVGGTTIAAIDPVARVVTLAGTADLKRVSRDSKAVIRELSVEDSWIVPEATAVMAAPVLIFRPNRVALHNSEGQMIGGGIRDLTISDRENGTLGRSLSGVQGVEVCGWDNFFSSHLRIENLAGAGLILGGCDGTVRESQFIDTQVRDSGEWRSGQASIELMTGYGGHPVDEINQIGFVGGGATFNYGVGLLIGSYVPAEQKSAGPRLLWFQSNFQVENGSHEDHGAGWNVGQPVDEVEIQRAVDVYFQGVSLAAPGFGHALVAAQSLTSLTVSDSRLYAAGKGTTYTVTVTRGSRLVQFVRGGGGSFQTAPLWDGNGVTVTGAGCAEGCHAWLDEKGAVSDNGLSLTLSTPYQGVSSKAATLEIRGGGYYFELGAGIRKITALGNMYNDPADRTSSLLEMRSSEGFVVGSGARNACLVTDYPPYDGLSVSGSRCRMSSTGSGGSRE